MILNNLMDQLNSDKRILCRKYQLEKNIITILISTEIT